ncbi:unnamed protein product [Urochloa humidicola]
MAGSSPKSPSPSAPPSHSHPSDVELIDSYLRRRVVSGPGATVGDFINEADLYAVGPDHLTAEFRPVTSGDGKTAWYFFTTLKHESGFKHAGIKRAVDSGEGRWEEEGSPQPVLGGRPTRQIGQRQAFAFARNEEGARGVRSGWFMVELRVDPSDLLVVCKVYRGPSDDDPKPIDAAGPMQRLEIWEAGDKDPGAETAAGAAASPGARQKKPVAGEGVRPSTAREIDAADKGKAPDEPQPEELEAPAAPALDGSPTEAQLIEYYLRPWADTGEKASELIHEIDVYANAPDDLIRRYQPAVAADRGEEVWYFLTKLRIISASNGRVIVERRVGTGEGYWHRSSKREVCGGSDGKGPRIGQGRTFTFARKDGNNPVNLGWMMVELRIDPSKPEALCKVYRSPKTPESKEAHEEAASVVGVVASAVGAVAPRREEDGEEIDSAAAAAGLGLKRKAGDQGSGGADTAAASPGSQKKDVGESPGAASLDAAAEEVEAPAEPEGDDPTKPKLHKFF